MTTRTTIIELDDSFRGLGGLDGHARRSPWLREAAVAVVAVAVLLLLAL
jgi:hypothetical protein